MDVLENTLVAMLYGNNWILGKQHHRNCWNLYSELTHTAGFLLMSLTFGLFTTFAGIELIFQQGSSLWLNLKLNSFVKILMKVDEILQHLTNRMLSKIQLNFPSMPCCQSCSTMYNVLTILSLRLCATIFYKISQGMMAVFYRWCVQIRNFVICRYEVSSGFCASRIIEICSFLPKLFRAWKSVVSSHMTRCCWVYVMALCPSLCHKRVFCQNGSAHHYANHTLWWPTDSSYRAVSEFKVTSCRWFERLPVTRFTYLLFGVVVFALAVSYMHSLGHNQTPIVVDLLLISGLWLVNHDVMQLNIEINQPQLESGCPRRTQLLRKVCLHFPIYIVLI